ncbi:MAG: 30S ribosomal protein S8 [Planctomycetota bacterium]|nr:MAG: 30S ribosomal protein S8 [Planctomycetota bacterium]
MTMTDPVADMLTRIRNAVRVEKEQVRIPLSNLKLGISKALEREGYIHGFEVEPATPCSWIVMKLKYGPEGERIINHIQRNSKPGRRIYVGVDNVKPVLKGLGVSILSTSSGILSDREARKKHVGGELLCTIW